MFNTVVLLTNIEQVIDTVTEAIVGHKSVYTETRVSTHLFPVHTSPDHAVKMVRSFNVYSSFWMTSSGSKSLIHFLSV